MTQPPIVAVPEYDNAALIETVAKYLTDAGWKVATLGADMKLTHVHPAVTAGVITPLQKTVEAIAKLVGGPADGNLVEHVRAMVDGAAKALSERDEARTERVEALEKAAKRERQLSKAWQELEAARENFIKARDERDTLHLRINELHRDLGNWENRFEALTGARTPDLAGNELIRQRHATEGAWRELRDFLHSDYCGPKCCTARCVELTALLGDKVR